ncbi:DMT family transporter [Lishizhenia sp.]|uniref:DMT family transporter n=1 Tax=Lishizhenia sp. TaxID=2497594 RepID=UPI00299DA584|nr:DMT family transporter [Lishizhenia sp.]MDX1445587.1 DMT family transporter [Lishizhenia sp.]
MRNVIIAHLALFAVNMIYGANYILAKDVMPNYLGPNAFIFMRVAGASLLFWIILLFQKREKIERKDWLKIAACGLFGIAMNQLFFFNGLSLTSGINASIIMTSTPIIVAVLAFFIRKEALSKMKVSGIVIGAIGAISLTLAGSNPAVDSALGDLFIFVNAASYSVYLILAKSLMEKYKPLTVLTYVMTFGLFLITLFPLTIPELMDTDFASFTGPIIGKVIFVIVGVTFIAYLFNIFALQHVSPTVSGSYIYLQPILAIFFAFFFFYIGISDDDSGSVSLEKVLYMLLVFAGVFITSRSTYLENKKRKALARNEAKDAQTINTVDQ